MAPGLQNAGDGSSTNGVGNIGNESNTPLGNGDLTINNRQERDGTANIALIQTWVPIYDGVSAVTPTYLIDTVEKLTTNACIPDIQKIQLVLSKIKGEPLTQLINNDDLRNSTNFKSFRETFLKFFGKADSLAIRQQNLSYCKQRPDEDIKSFAARLTQTTRLFLGQVDYENEEIKKIYNQTRLAKLIEGVLPAFRFPLLTREVSDFEEAVRFIQLLQSNKQLLESEAINVIKTDTKQNMDSDIEALRMQVQTLQLQSQYLQNQLDRQNKRDEYGNHQQTTQTDTQHHRQGNYTRQQSNNYRGNSNRGRQQYSTPRGQFHNARGYNRGNYHSNNFNRQNSQNDYQGNNQRYYNNREFQRDQPRDNSNQIRYRGTNNPRAIRGRGSNTRNLN